MYYNVGPIEKSFCYFVSHEYLVIYHMKLFKLSYTDLSITHVREQVYHQSQIKAQIMSTHTFNESYAHFLIAGNRVSDVDKSLNLPCHNTPIY